jgi:oligopeptide transport system substrate-binding protein
LAAWRLPNATLALVIGLMPALLMAEQVLHRGGIGDPETMDPQGTGSGTEGTIMTDLFTSLLTPGPAGDIVLGTADSWSVSADGKSYIFKLRKGLKWSDGRPLTAGDYVYGIQRLMNPKSGAFIASYMFSIVNAEAVNRGALPPAALGVSQLDEHTLRVRLRSPTPYFPEMLAVIWYPAPRHVIEAFGPQWIRPGRHVGNGPFKLAEWIPNQYVKLVKNEHFYDAASVALDAVVHYPAEDISTSMRRFRAGELHIVTAFPAQQLQWVKDNLPEALHITPTINLEAYLFNTSKPPLDDPRVRLALSMAIDREMLVTKILRGGEQPAHGIIPPSASNYPNHARAPFSDLTYEQRLARARDLLAAAGFNGAAPLKVELRLNASEISKQVALAILSMWKPLAVEATLLASEDKARLRDIRTGNYQIAASLRLSASADPFVFLQPFHGNAGPTNITRYRNERFDEWLDQAGKTANLNARARLLERAEAQLLADQPMVPLYFYSSKKLISPAIDGWVDNPKGINPARYLSVVN